VAMRCLPSSSFFQTNPTLGDEPATAAVLILVVLSGPIVIFANWASMFYHSTDYYKAQQLRFVR